MGEVEGGGRVCKSKRFERKERSLIGIFFWREGGVQAIEYFLEPHNNDVTTKKPVVTDSGSHTDWIGTFQDHSDMID